MLDVKWTSFYIYKVLYYQQVNVLTLLQNGK